jgi:hypothetical protein
MQFGGVVDVSNSQDLPVVSGRCLTAMWVEARCLMTSLFCCSLPTFLPASGALIAWKGSTYGSDVSRRWHGSNYLLGLDGEFSIRFSRYALKQHPFSKLANRSRSQYTIIVQLPTHKTLGATARL